MELLIIIALVLVVAILISFTGKSAATKRKIYRNNHYVYSTKPTPMTRTETEFFQKLDRTVSQRYYVFVQVHLSAFLDHTTTRQDWSPAFRHINSKSVDYLLCDKETLRPTYAVELDDYTHEKKDRKTRDAEVERILKEAGLPLVRIKNKDISENDIISALTSSMKQTRTRH